MKTFLVYLGAAVFLVATICGIFRFVGDLVGISARAKLAHETKCKDARVEFFEDCYKTTTRPYCEMMWAEKHGHVFDASPDKPWADEIDCSDEVK